MKRIFAFMILCFLVGTSFVSDSIFDKNYTLTFEAKGCHYQISLNGKIIEDGKTYSRIHKNIKLEKFLSDSVDQKIDIMMYRISREMNLKTTQAFVNVKLEKGEADSVELIKEVKLPTFPYDNDEQQPQSIGGSIEFQLK